MFVQQLLQQQAHQRQHHCPLTRRTQSRREQSISSSNGGGGGGGGGSVGARADAVVALATLDGGERNTAQKPGRRRGRQQRARRGYRSPKRTMCRLVSYSGSPHAYQSSGCPNPGPNCTDDRSDHSWIRLALARTLSMVLVRCRCQSTTTRRGWQHPRRKRCTAPSPGSNICIYCGRSCYSYPCFLDFFL